MRFLSPKLWGGAFAALTLCLSASISQAGVTYTFKGVTSNDVNDVATGESQLTVTVEAVGANQVSFTFTNAGPNASSITDVYFDDGTLLGIASITDSGAGVDFTQFASPGDLPGGTAINFNTSAGFSADSTPPAQPNGVNPGESLTITFNLINGKTYADTIAALTLSLANPGVDVPDGLRIGIHVQGFAGGGSEAFVNGPPPRDVDPPNGVPAPGGLVLVASMLPFAWGLRRRLTRKDLAA